MNFGVGRKVPEERTYSPTGREKEEGSTRGQAIPDITATSKDQWSVVTRRVFYNHGGFIVCNVKGFFSYFLT